MSLGTYVGRVLSRKSSFVLAGVTVLIERLSRVDLPGIYCMLNAFHRFACIEHNDPTRLGLDGALLWR